MKGHATTVDPYAELLVAAALGFSDGGSMLALNMLRAGEELARAAEIRLRHSGPGAASALGEEMAEYSRTLGRAFAYWTLEPQRALDAQLRISRALLAVMAEALGPMAPCAADGSSLPKDPRFQDPAWSAHPYFYMLRRAYHETVAWAAELIAETPDLDDDTRRLTQLHLTQISAALSPSNFIATNPDLLRETMRERGANLVRGARMLAEDLEAGRGVLKIRQSDSTSFELGVNIASTPGTVIFRNELIELIQYAPATPGVRRRPLLIVPSWINKFYILDLTPEKSFVRWAVSQGLTVFIISWVNPDERHGAKRFDDYLVDGLFAALGAVEAETGERRVDVAGYCVGGTLVAAGAAHEAAAGEDRIASLTLLAAQVDFSAAGDLKALFDEAKVRLLEDRMYARGFLEGTDMASAFNMLRPNDLIWSYVVNVYLKGQPPTAFDLLHWNSDSTRIPAANHAFYLRRCYLENSLARGLMVLAGERLDLARVTIPIYCLATREDHIAPARSVFIGAQCFGSEVVFVLAGSGHIAGVVNPPAKQKYEYWTGPVPTGAIEDWISLSARHAGSWWPHWRAWLQAISGEQAAPRTTRPGDLGDAPGEYVCVRC